jgi:hypothetical protein
MGDVSLSHRDLRDLTSLGTGGMTLPLVQQKCNARVREGAGTTRKSTGTPTPSPGRSGSRSRENHQIRLLARFSAAPLDRTGRSMIHHGAPAKDLPAR